MTETRSGGGEASESDDAAELEDPSVAGEQAVEASVPRPAPAFPKPDVPARPLTDFAAAIGFLTLLPLGRTWPEGRAPRSVGWYAWVGWILGLVAFVPLTLLRPQIVKAGMPGALLGGVLVVTVWALLTRFLHWDGIADAFDGLWGGHTPERRLEIMRDSHIGPFGVVAILLGALIQVACVTLLISHGVYWPLLAAPVAARFSLSLAAWELPAARADGLGRTAIGQAGVYERILAGVALLALLACMSLGATSHQFIWVVGAGVVGGLVIPRLLSKPVGGMTGDLFGATVLLVEMVVLLTAAVMA
jgi:adenosylcobinamide-GDP ribazoletransferase